MSRATALALALVFTGCLDPFEPDVGPLIESACENADSNPALDVSFSADLRAGVLAGCLDCHSPGGEGLATSGLDMSSYAALRTGGALSGAAIVVDGRPCDSVLVQKLGRNPPFGARMPRDGPPFLTDAEVRRVRDWIVEGARDN